VLTATFPAYDTGSLAFPIRELRSGSLSDDLALTRCFSRRLGHQ
jgi:hypothetical protein